MGKVTLVEAVELAELQEEVEGIIGFLQVIASELEGEKKDLVETLSGSLIRLSAVLIKAGIWVEDVAN